MMADSTDHIPQGEILVVDDNTDVYSQVGSQFLTTLSSNQNAAYVSASAKLNNIQVD